MFAADPAMLRKLLPRIERVLVLDPVPTSGKMMSEFLRDFGARQITLAVKTSGALGVVGNVDPQLILTEYRGPDFDGVSFVRELRRSRMSQRTVPVILYTAEATVESIKGARDAGAHEFLRKPYAMKDLFRRVENVMLKPRDWIEAQMYVGPDRRRFNSESYVGPRKRGAEKAA